MTLHGQAGDTAELGCGCRLEFTEYDGIRMLISAECRDHAGQSLALSRSLDWSLELEPTGPLVTHPSWARSVRWSYRDANRP